MKFSGYRHRFMVRMQQIAGSIMPGFCMMLLIILACDKTDSDHVVETGKIPFMIENLGVRFGPWDRSTNTAGDFLFTDISNVTRIVGEFGLRVVSYDGSYKYLPNMDFIVRDSTPVMAIAEGEVTRYFFQDGSNDYEIGIRSLNDPDFEVGYDHLVNILVEPGDIVAPGDPIGNPRPLFYGLGSFEIMISCSETGLSYCPFCVFNPDKIDSCRSQLIRLMEDWETFRSDTTIYEESAFVFPGCLMESMISY
ncbi:M23 family metallopeptidase [bacterium]|nr:M23 family metallopeptidase [bacterium]